MQILITGATSVIGRVAAAQMVAAGHRVTGVAQRSHPCLDPRVDLVCAPLHDPVLQELADASDTVIHLAPIEPDVPESAGIAGVVHVTHAASKAGARLLFLSHAAGDPGLYRQAEELVASSFSPSLVIRVAPPVGRHADWMVCRTVASLLTADIAAPVRLLHTDDLHRFLIRSVGSHRTGTVDLATADAVSPVSARRRLASVEGKPRRIAAWPVLDPDLNVAPLQHDWEFECGWTAAIAVADTGQGLAGRRLGATGAEDIAGKLALPVEVTPRDIAADGSGLHKAAQDGVAGEFDDLIDPRYPKFSALCTSDALPGPLTPMTLDLHLAGLRAAHRATAELLGLPAALAHEWERRGVAVFAHRLFTGVSIGDQVSAKVPGGGRGLLTNPSADAAVAARAVGISRRYGCWCNDYPHSAQKIGAEACAGLSDASLETRIRLLRTVIHRGWTLATVGTLVEGLLLRAGRRDHRVIPLLAATTSTGELAAETAAFADILRTDPQLCDLASSGDLTAIGVKFPRAAAAFEAALVRVGHRGPGEAELANPVIADSPSQLLAAAALAADVPVATPGAADRTAAALRRADSVRVLREDAWDNTVRFTHQMRIALRERGSRLTSKRMIAAADDVFYLTVDESLAPPVDARLRVQRRRAERERLQSINMPDIVDGRWAALPDDGRPDCVAVTERDLEPQSQV